MEHTKNNAAKFAFFYMLSLVALIFMALSSGMIIFQIINKFIIDVINTERFSDDALKFAISAIIVSTPIYYFTMRQIGKNLLSGELKEESGIRKWLTYFILLVSSVVMIGWFIATINSFFNGELTTKFILKAVTAIGIAALIFSFYLYDIKRSGVAGKKDKVINIYTYLTLVAVIVIFIASLFIVESPTATRNRKQDEKVLSQFSQIDSAIQEYLMINDKLPNNFDELIDEVEYLSQGDIKNPNTGNIFDYKILSENRYELCDTFLTSNKGEDGPGDLTYIPYKELWPHEAGYQCIDRTIKNNNKEMINRVPGEEPVIIR
jgi:type II secretory pathway pseudopilin PulG